MTNTILPYVNICVKKGNDVLLLNRQHDDFKGWIPPGGKVAFPETIFEAAKRELQEETGLTALNLELKGLSGFVNPDKNEQYMYYDFLCTHFTGELIHTREGEPHWWPLSQLKTLPMQDDIRERLPLYFRKGSFERVHIWSEDKGGIVETKTTLYD